MTTWKFDVMRVWKNTDTTEADFESNKLTEAAEADGYEFDWDAWSEMRFQDFKAGYFAGLSANVINTNTIIPQEVTLHVENVESKPQEVTLRITKVESEPQEVTLHVTPAHR